MKIPRWCNVQDLSIKEGLDELYYEGSLYPVWNRLVIGRGVMVAYINRPPYRELGQVQQRQLGLDSAKHPRITL